MAGPDMTPFISQIAIGGVVVMLLAIAGAIAVVIIARTGAGQVLRSLYGKYESHEREIQFNKRYAREQKSRAYREWKKGRKY